MLTRRTALGAGAGFLAGVHALTHSRRLMAADVVEIRMMSNSAGSRVYFDPIGVLVEPGQRIRWRCVSNVHTTTAYHPSNTNHSLRIPETARSWDSDYLLPGHTLEVTLTVEGVYDYFCKPHEIAGMVGRIIVGHPAGPGVLPFDYFRSDPTKRSWRSVPELAQKALPPTSEIMERRLIRGG